MRNRFFCEMTIRASAMTADDSSRSVDAVLATESPVTVRRAGELIDEVLLTAGVELPDYAPLLDTHQQFNLDAVMGSASTFRRVGSEIHCRLHFASYSTTDPESLRADRVWRNVRDGHLSGISCGYSVTQATEIPSGRTGRVAGRTFTAGSRSLRVATAWQIREVSLVPIAADWRTVTRQDSGDDSQRIRPVVSSARFDHDQVTRDAVAAERRRMAELQELFGDDCPELLDQAIGDGWTVGRASVELARVLRVEIAAREVCRAATL